MDHLCKEALMQHKKRRMAAIAAALMVAAIAAIGTGLAVTYYAETSTVSNDVDAEYIVLTIGSNQSSDYTGHFSGNVYYNTETSTSAVTTWTPVLDTDTDNDGVNDACFIGQLVLNVDDNGSVAYTITMENVSGTITGDLIVGYALGSDSATYANYTNGMQLVSGLNGDNTLTVSLYYSTSPVTSAPTDPLQDLTVRFTATASS